MDKFTKIERFLLNKMTQEERVLFEKEIDENKLLKDEVQKYSQLIIAIESKSFSDNLNAFSIPNTNSINKTSVVKQIFQLRKWAAAASIIGIALCSWWLYSYSSQRTISNKYAKVFYKDPGLPTPMSEIKQYDFYDAMVDYKYGDYSIALSKWNTIIDGIGLDTLNYYKGMAYLGLGEWDQSLEFLQKIEVNSDLNEKSKWYLIEIYLRQNKTTLAQELLDSMKESSNFDKKSALRILQSIN